MDAKQAAQQLEKAKATLATVADFADLHAEGCARCNGHFKCDRARYWADEAEDAERVVEAFQQQLRRATLAAAR